MEHEAPARDRREYPPDVRVRLDRLEQWRTAHDAWAEAQAKRLDTVWDWRLDVRPMLATMNRLMWAILGVLLSDLAISGYLALTRK